MAISLTERAAQEVKSLLTQQSCSDASLRIWVEGSGCSGLQYGMALDDQPAEEGELFFESFGVKVVIDPLSMQYMDGAEVDFIDDPAGGGFKIENPNQVGCGCGSKDGEEGESGCGGCKGS
ncbi:MAG: iron-sulfur cluster assembly accessory protein [bacterium]|jgi:iron-sulfur cluster assembly protein